MSSRKVTNISEYAIGGRNFSTPIMIATIIATWVDGAFFSYGLVETYRQGIYFIIPAIADCLGMMLIGWLLAPRMGEFLGKFSIVETMGQMFGSKVRIITVIFALIRCIGSLGVQFKVASKVLETIFDTSGEYATVLSAVIVIIYSTIGGIRAVTFTDVIQFFTFGCLIPAIGIILWQILGSNNTSIIYHTLSTSPLFDYSAAFNLHNPKSYHMFVMFVLLLCPQFEPTAFQRISMGRNINQVVKSFRIAGIICLIMQCIVIGIGILILTINPNINPDNLIQYIINSYTYAGFKGLVAVGIMAMIMSSADSLINSLSIIFAHDLCRPLGFKWARNELLVARVTAVVAGLIGIFLALQFDRVLSLVLSFTTLYIPIVSLPFILVVLGFRSSGNSVLAGTFGSLLVIVICRMFLGKTPIQTFLPSLIANLICLFAYHYFMKQPGGWNGGNSNSGSSSKISKTKQFITSIKNFHFTKFMEKNSPSNQAIYCYTGIFCFLSFGLNIITIKYNLEIFSNFIHSSTFWVLFIATSLFIYPLWSCYLKNRKIILSLIWNISVLYSLVFVGFMFAVASNFASVQVMILVFNLIAIVLLVRWQWALVLILFGVFGAWKFTNVYFLQLTYADGISWKLQVIYTLVLVGSLLLIFLKSKQKDINYRQKSIPETLSPLTKRPEIQKYRKKLDAATIAHMFFDFYK
ncbi:sodium:solute symporter family protein [Candidatus Phycorickettsia trachydisci]|nr:sodium:solute symporter family protein [Candidatus Phycorickettsia trachydisci]